MYLYNCSVRSGFIALILSYSRFIMEEVCYLNLCLIKKKLYGTMHTEISPTTKVL